MKTSELDWRLATNAWADAVICGLQWMQNIRDGISTPGQAIENMELQIAHCVERTPAITPTHEVAVCETSVSGGAV